MPERTPPPDDELTDMLTGAGGLDEARLLEVANALDAQIDQLEQSIALLREKHAALRGALRGVRIAIGQRVDTPKPKGSEAVGIVAMEAIAKGHERDEDGALTVAEIVRELDRRGWSPDSDNPKSAVRAAIRRLRDGDPRWGLYDGRLYYHDRPLPSESDDEEEG